MRSLYSNSDTPFDTLPFAVRRELIEKVYWIDLTADYAPTEWGCERYLRTLSSEQLEEFRRG